MKREKGLTLAELVIAMAILAILAVAMIPGLGSWLDHNRIKGAARDIGSGFRLAQMTAVQRNRTCRVRFDKNNRTVTVFVDAGDTLRTIDLDEYRAEFDTSKGGGDGLDFVDGGDSNVDVDYNTRGIPSDEQGAPLTPPGGQEGQRVFLQSGGGRGYWVEVTPVGSIRFDRY